MPSNRTLALLAHPESVGRVPDVARILPLAPLVPVPVSRLLVRRPEDLLTAEDTRAVEGRARELAADWWRGSPRSSFTWRGQNLAECFSSELVFVARDVIKANRILDRALEQTPAEALATDVPPVRGTFPPYPYLTAIGSLVEFVANASRRSIQRLWTATQASRQPRTSRLVHAYATVAARQAIARMRSGHFVVGVGPFPESYGPVARQWSNGNGYTVVVSSPHAPIRASPSAGLYFAPLDAFMTSSDREQIGAFVETAVHSMAPRPPRTWTSDGDRPFLAVFFAEVQRRLRQQLPELASLGIAFERGLDRADRLMLMETSSPISKAAICFGRSRGIPIVAIQHGVIADPDSYRETDADRVAAWGPLDASWFAENLPGPVRTSPTGNPRYDRLVIPQNRDARRRLRNISRGARVLLFASAPFGHLNAAESLWDYDALQSIVLEGVSRIPNTFLLFKRHPSEARRPLPSVPEGITARWRELVGGDTFALIHASDVVMSVESSVTLEAMYLNRPTVFIGRRRRGSPYHPPEDGGGLRAQSAAELETHLRRLLEDNNYQAEVLRGQQGYLRRSFAPLDGHAAERFAVFLRSE